MAVCYDQLAPNNVVNWNLPTVLRPAGAVFTTPSRNLLGWRPRVGHPLSIEARNLLQECGIEGQYNAVTGDIDNLQFARNRGGLPINYQLLNHVSDRLGTISDKTPLIIGFVETLIGSQSQLGFVIPLETSPGQRSTNQVIQPRCSTQLISARGNAIAVFKPRVQYVDTPTSYIYRLAAGEVVPPEWIATINAAFTSNQAERINGDEFGLPNTDGRIAVAEFVANLTRKT